MKYRNIFLTIVLLVGIVFVDTKDVFAGETVVYDSPAEGVTNIGARMRADTNISSAILKVLPRGTAVKLFGEEYGWYKLEYNGVVGYTALWLIDKTNNKVEAGTEIKKVSTEVLELFGKYKHRSRVRKSPSLDALTIATYGSGIEVEIIEKKTGWYKVKHSSGAIGWSADWLFTTYNKKIETEIKTQKEDVKTDGVKYGKYLYNSRMRSTNSSAGVILKTHPIGTKVIILSEKNGWYQVESADGKVGWSAAWLITQIEKIASQVEGEKIVTKTLENHRPLLSVTKDQEGIVPDGVDLVELNEYWLGKINALRADQGLHQLVLDQRWVDTAAEYAGYMGRTGAQDHARSNGSSMHDWIDTKGLAFTTRYSTDGWKTNYFTENIAWGYTDGATVGVKRVLDNTLDFFLGEASYNGAHYRTIYHADWNSVGLGFYFKPEGNGRYKVFAVMHYGSLEL